MTRDDCPDVDVLPELRCYGATMTIDDVIEVLNVDRQLARRVMSEQLSGFKVGRLWRVRRAEMQRLLTGELLPHREEEDTDA